MENQNQSLTTVVERCDEVPEGRRRARAAFLRDFEKLHADRKIRGKYVAYHLENMITVARDYNKLVQDMYARGTPASEWLVFKVTPSCQVEEKMFADEAEIDPV